MTTIFAIIGLLLLIPDSYIYFIVLAGVPWWGRVLFLVPTITFLLVLCHVFIVRIFGNGDLGMETINLLFWGTLIIVLPTIIFTLISLIGRGAGLFWSRGPAIFNLIGMVAAMIWLLISLYGVTVGWKRIVLERVNVASNRIPEAFDGYRIVQLSDFHIGTYSASRATVDSIVKRVNSLKPDLIVFTGDLINTTSEEIDEFTEVLSRLKARDGIYSVLGNHDYCLYRAYEAPDSPQHQFNRVIKTEKAMGWTMLRNSSVQLNRVSDSISLIGVDNAGTRSFGDHSDLPLAMDGLPSESFKILLSHDPSHWRREVLPSSDIDLTLSGHTHAMQFRIGNWSPSKWIYREWGGLYSNGDRHLYVSTGVGENIAFRFGAWPQIVEITLHSAPK